ncbi:ATP-dependent DNA helicase [Cutibacterium equinum]|uniref:DNA 3'-5' helicase n=1 Tax=Cutibacterium equinum TaxID=3016342 RepID=A0ABY7QVK1_9ACTN|nr:ATP-dependent DNA helicase [Cutibacterium equinum]WCC79106.1 ATP-dependent DNA helicase [Cutibacterium equinum]
MMDSSSSIRHDDVDLAALLGFELSDEQETAVEAPLEPCVVIAGAGTGKTTVMGARVLWLVATGRVRPEEILGLTFTNKAASELSGRIEENLTSAGLLTPEQPRPTVATYDSFAGTLVADYGPWDGIDTGAHLITGARAYQLAMEVVSQLDKSPLASTHLTPASIAQAVVSLAGAMASHDASEDAVRAADARWRQMLVDAPTRRNGGQYASVRKNLITVDEREDLLDLVRAYQDLKRRRGFVEFGDRMLQALHLVSRHPRVGQELRARYRVVLLDEYQDTSSAQADLLAALFSGPDPAHGRGHPVMAVGDPLQAIYEWRGAAASNILDFHRRFPQEAGSPATMLSLATNRRCANQIIDAANIASQELREFLASSLTSVDDGEDDDAKPAVGRPLDPPQENRRGDVDVAAYLTWADECRACADEMVEAKERGAIERWSEAAILVRRNSDVADLYDALTSRDIPVRVANLSGLLTLPDVAMVVAHLRVLVDRHDDAAMAALLAAPRFGLGTDGLAEVHRRARALAKAQAKADGLDPEDVDVHLVDAVMEDRPVGDERVRSALEHLAAEIVEIAAHQGDSPDDLILRIESVTGLVDDMAADDPSRSLARRDQLDTLWEEVREVRRSDPDMTLPGIVSWLAAEEDHGHGLSRASADLSDAVTISTVHAAKGLEWPFVIIPDMAQGVFPSELSPKNFVTVAGVLPSFARGDASEISHPVSGSETDTKGYVAALKEDSQWSEARLAYVALTRAKERLIVSWHKWDSRRKGCYSPGKYADLVAGMLGVAWPDLGERPEDRVDDGIPWPVLADEGAIPITGAELSGGADLPVVDDPKDADRVASWQADAQALLAEARRRRDDTDDVVIPARLTTSQMVRLHANPQAFQEDLLRPMPRPADRGAGIGTAFHEWVSQRLAPHQPIPLFDAEEISELEEDSQKDDGDAVVRSVEADALQTLRQAFENSRWAHATVLAVEEPFVMTIGNTVVRGRLDAVVADPDHPGDELVIDWKTSKPRSADPLQLSIYRLAWTQARGIDPSRVRAVFHHVGANETITAEPLLDADQLAGILDGVEGESDTSSG